MDVIRRKWGDGGERGAQLLINLSSFPMAGD